MDQFQERLKNDVRLLKRNLRNHLISEKQIKKIQDALPDCKDNARWLRQDGTACDVEEEKVLLRYHDEGWDELLTGTEAAIGQKTAVVDITGE